MNKTNISPTRMERLHQRDRLHTANHAHKLLKDKSDEMMRTFSQLIKQNKTLRERVEKDLHTALLNFVTSSAKLPNQIVESALATVRYTVKLTTSTRNIMGLVVPQVEVDAITPPIQPLITTPATFDQALQRLQQLTTVLVELANIEKMCSMLADEIQRVRRRINSLEYNMIPEIQGTIKFITMKLDENQRETQIRVMKVKEMQTPED